MSFLNKEIGNRVVSVRICILFTRLGCLYDTSIRLEIKRSVGIFIDWLDLLLFNDKIKWQVGNRSSICL